MSADLHALRRDVAEGRLEESAARLTRELEDPHLTEGAWNERLALLGEVYQKLGLERAAATIYLYRGRMSEAEVLSTRHPTDLARCALARKDPASAARFFERAGWLGHAAMELEDAGDDRAARVLWERLAGDPRLRTDPYTHGLVRFDLSRACERLGDKAAAREAMIESMHLLEAAADGFEARGRRERAFDCYQVLVSLGREHGAYENLAEGYLNCIRILKQDNLRYYALQFYEDFQQLSLERGELHAAATLYREAADYCRRVGLPYERYHRVRAAETMVSAGNRIVREEGPAELAENAFTAAVDAFLDVGSYSRARRVYQRLGELPLGEARHARYRRLEALLEAAADEPIDSGPLPAYLRSETAYPEIWRLDVIEWEQGGDAAETMAAVVADTRWPEHTRRRALLARLHQLSDDQRPSRPEALMALADLLARVEVYAVLAPIEGLAAHPDARVRAAAMRAARRLFFKRTFVSVEACLGDPDAAVRREALEALKTMCFAHAFDPLARIYHQSPDREVRKAALASLGRIPTSEATELLIEVLRVGEPEERQLAVWGLARSDDPEATALLDRAIAAESGAARTRLEEVRKQRRR
jgi:HEAT repeat protein